MLLRTLLCLLLFSVSASAEETPAGFAGSNVLLRDTLALQQQIQLLKNQVARESQVNELIQAGKDIGATRPEISKPDHAICEQIPANIPCAQAYDDLYTGFDVRPALPTALTKVAEAPRPAPRTKTPTAVAVAAKPTLFWLDITCLDTECSALVASNPGDAKTRQRVRVGTRINNATISAISAGGVTVVQNGKTIRIPPAPRA